AAVLAARAWEATATSGGAASAEAFPAGEALAAGRLVEVASAGAKGTEVASAVVKELAEASAVREVARRHPAIVKAGPMEDLIFSHNRSWMTAGLRYFSIHSKLLL